MSGRLPTEFPDKKALGYVPEGLAALGGWWHALLQDYGIPNSPFSADATSLFHQSIGYYLASVVGIAIIAGITLLIGRLIAHREGEHTEDERQLLKKS